MLHEAILVSSIWFFAILAVYFLAIVWCTESEMWKGASLATFALLAGIVLFSDFNLLLWIKHHPIEFGIGCVAYFVPLGVIVVFTKWWFFQHDALDKNKEVKALWLKDLPHKVDSLKENANYAINNAANIENESKKGTRYTAEQVAAAKEDAVKKTKRLKDVGEAIEAGCKMTEGIWPMWLEYEASATWTDYLGRRRPLIRPTAASNKARLASWAAWWPAVGLWSLLRDPMRRIANWLYYRMAGLLERISLHIWKDADEFKR